MDNVEIKGVPRLGSLHESARMAKQCTFEMLGFEKRLMKESGKSFFSNWSRTAKIPSFVRFLGRKDESIMALPSLDFEGSKYAVIRFGPRPFRVSRAEYVPSGYTVLRDDNTTVNDLELATRIAKVCRIWEEVYIRPYKPPMSVASKTMLEWNISVETQIRDMILQRNREAPDESATSEELTVLHELDREVLEAYDARIELMQLDRKLGDQLFNLFEHPSDANITEFVSITYMVRELTNQEKAILERRYEVWSNYRDLLERKYDVPIKLEVDWDRLAFAAFVDLTKYVIWKHVIPEGILTESAYNVLRDTARARFRQEVLNLLVHAGGIAALRRGLDQRNKLMQALQHYIELWEAGIPTDMIRIPEDTN